MRSGVRLGGTVVLAVAMVACGQRDDSGENVSKALKQANLDQVNVDYDKDAKIVHLKGNVRSLTDRTRAEDVAAAAVGTSGRVLNELTVEGMNDRTADDMDGQIRDVLDTMIDNDPTLKERDINFDVHNGVVTVKGEVRTADEKSRVTDIVKTAPGVKDLANALAITPAR